MALLEYRNIFWSQSVNKNPVFQWILLLLAFGNTVADASLEACPTASTSTIGSPCKFSPGVHSYQSLIIASDVFFETTGASSRHTLKVTQTLEIQQTGSLIVGLNEESSNQGSGMDHSRGGTGGSFGGRGGAASGMTLGSSQAVPYGHPFNVSIPGSRGGGSGRGKGGGFLQLEARKIIMNGVASAPGGSATGDGGGGSGGGIALFCFEIDGTGKIEANGGTGSGTGGGGSGGRLSITYKQGTFRLKTHTYGGKIGTDVISLSGSRSASSEYRTSWPSLVYSASHGVLNYHGSTGGWRAAQDRVNEYLQVTLSRNAYVTSVATQGRYSGSEYVRTYSIKYRDVDVDGPSNLRDYKENGEKRIFLGNVDINTVKRNQLAVPIHTDRVRFVALTWNSGIAMRVDVEGYFSDPTNQQSCSYVAPQGSPEAGGPGTVFVDGYKNGVLDRLLVVDNLAAYARVNTSSEYDAFKQSGGIAWLLLDNNAPKIDRLQISRGAQVLLAGNNAQLNVDTVTNDGTGHLYVSPSVRLQVDSNLSPCTKIFSGGELIIPRGSSIISIERSLSVHGKLTLLNNPRVSFGRNGGTFKMYPESSPRSLQFEELLLEQSYVAHLMNYDTNLPSSCRWLLGTNGQLVLKDSAVMTVDCPVELKSNHLSLQSKSSFIVNGNGSITNFTVNIMDIYGTLKPGLLSVGVGLQRVTIQEHGLLRLLPYQEFSVNELTVGGTLLFESPAFIRGRHPAVSSKITIDSSGHLEMNANSYSALSTSPLLLNGTSIIHAQVVTIAGKLLAKQLSIDPGWRTLTVTPTGNFQFSPVNWFSFDQISVSGTFTSSGALSMKGVSQNAITSLIVGSSGIIDIKSVGLSTILSDTVTIAGKLLARNLSIDPGWKMLTVESTGLFQFSPVNWFSFDQIIINGVFTSLKALNMKGLSQNTIPHLRVGSSGIVDINSKELTTILSDIVTIEGVARIGKIDLARGWIQLNVLGSKGEFHFESNTTMDTKSVRVSGRLLTNSVFASSNPIRVQNFTVLPGGTVSIHYQGAPISNGKGSMETTMYLQKLQVDGLFQTGSMYVESDDVLIGSTGRIDVNSGGCASDQGRGAGIGSSSGGSGASYGGRGGRGSGTRALNLPFGDIFTVGTWGSGGGRGSNAESGGRGGGTIHLIVNRTLQVNGEIQMNGQPGKSSNAGGGSGGSLWAKADSFTGSGRIRAVGGNGNSNGGGGAGGRISVFYNTGGFHSDSTIANGGRSSSENGGPGVVYLQGLQPNIKNLRIDNKGLQAMVSQDTGNFEAFKSTGAVAYLNPPSDGFTYEFTHIEVYGAAHLFFSRLNTHVQVDTIYGDDTGSIHVAPYTTLNMTSTSQYFRINVTWFPVIYQYATLVLPNGTLEIRQAKSIEYPGLTRSSHVSIWGRVIGDKSHLMVGRGGTLSFEKSSFRTLRFVGITIQKSGRLVFQSMLANETDQWIVHVVKDFGPVGREGVVTIEAEGRLEARSLNLRAVSLVVDPVGLLTLDGQGLLAGRGSGAGYGSADGSGAGYGGRGGRGVSTQQTGSPYGDFKMPRLFGSGGGGPGAMGGAGGGFLQLDIAKSLVVEGTITSSGQDGRASNTGGGSGGSIFINTHALEGSGVISVNGGSGYGNGGGGGGGRLAVYWKDREWWFGSLRSFGGSGSGSRNGGPGSVYLEDTHVGINNRTLIFDNNNQDPFTSEISNLSLPELDSGRAWLYPIGKEYELEEMHILRKAHVAMHPNITRPHGLKVYKFVGDRTGVLHVGPNQIVIGQFADLEKFEVNVYVHRDGHLHLPPKFTCFGIQITNRGYLGLDHMTVSQGCHLYLGLTASTELANKEGVIQFHSLTVADGGEVTSTSDVLDNTLIITVGEVKVKGGGDMHMKRIYMEAENLTIDDLGKLRADYHDARCSLGKGLTGIGSSGGGHGGNGGSGSNQPRVGIAYGHLYEPAHFGCPGGGGGSGLGGGVINITVRGTLKIDGTLSANGETAKSLHAGGGSGGSIFITTNVFRGYGDVQVNGGNGYVDVNSGVQLSVSC